MESVKHKDYLPYKIRRKSNPAKDIYILEMTPAEFPHTFKPGQYVDLRIPDYLTAKEHFFSISSSPTLKDSIEFCVKIEGEWTKRLVSKSEGEEIMVSHPVGGFIFKDTVLKAVFLVGGVGIAPVMCMIRYIRDMKLQGSYSLIYGGRSKYEMAYTEELEKLTHEINLHLVYAFSRNAIEYEEFPSYEGYINGEILKEEVKLQDKPIYFISGPSEFIRVMQRTLTGLGVTEKSLRYERIRLRMKQ